MPRPLLLTLAGLLACGLGAAPAVAQYGAPVPAPAVPPPPVLGPQGYQYPPPPPGAVPPAGPEQPGAARFVERFRAANTTNDGRLTLQQAQAAGLTPVVRHFAELDPTQRGFVTLQDVRSYMQRMRAMRAPPQNINE